LTGQSMVFEQQTGIRGRIKNHDQKIFQNLHKEKIFVKNILS